MKSQNGWPASSNPEAIDIVRKTIPGTDIKVRVAKKAAPYLIGFAGEFHALVEPIDKGELDDWGYAFRDIRGVTGTLSNHSSGSALDLNATKHVLGKRGTFKPEQVATIKRLCIKYHLRWGGDFSRPDEMHFEINFPPNEQPKIGK